MHFKMTLDILTETNSSHWCHSQDWEIYFRGSSINNYVLLPLFEVVTFYAVLFKNQLLLPAILPHALLKLNENNKANHSQPSVQSARR